MMKSTTTQSHWLLTLLSSIILLSGLTACSSSEGDENGSNPSKPDIPISNDDWQTVPVSGGTIEKDSISITFPSGTFTEDAKVAITDVRKGTIGGEFEASKFYQITMPCTANKPITIRMKSNEINDNIIFIAQSNAYCPSRGTVSKAQLQYETTYSNGEYTATIPALKGDVDGENELFSIGLCNVNSENAGTRLLSNLRYDVMKEGKVGKVNYQIRYSLTQKHRNLDKYHKAESIVGKINKYVQQALTKINDLGFKLDGEQTLYIDFDPDDKDWGGHKVCGIPFAEGFAMWVSLGVDMLTASTTTDDDIKCTVIHEIFHWFQSFFDTRSNYKKSRKEYHGDEMVMYEMGAVWIEQFMNKNKLNEVFLKQTAYKYFNNYSNLGLIDYVDIWKVIDESGETIDPYGYQGYSMAPLLYYLCSTKEFESWNLDNNSVYELHKLWKDNFGTKTTVEIMEKWLKGNHEYDFFYGNKIDDYYLKLLEGKLVKNFSLAHIKGTPDKSDKVKFSHEFDGIIYPFGCEVKKVFIGGDKWNGISLDNSELVVKQMEEGVHTYLIIYDEDSGKYINIKGNKAATTDDPIVLEGDKLESLRHKDGSFKHSFYLVTTRITSSISDKGTKSSKCSIEIKDKEETGKAYVNPDKVRIESAGSTELVTIDKGNYKYCGVEPVPSAYDNWLSVQFNADRNEVAITAVPNNTDVEREGTIYCWVSNKKKPKDSQKKLLPVTIIQDAGNTEESLLDVSELVFPVEGGVKTIKYSFGEYKWLSRKSDDDTWLKTSWSKDYLSAIAYNPSNDNRFVNELYVSAFPNETGVERSQEIRFGYTNEKGQDFDKRKIYTVNVMQEGGAFNLDMMKNIFVGTWYTPQDIIYSNGNYYHRRRTFRADNTYVFEGQTTSSTSKPSSWVEEETGTYTIRDYSVSDHVKIHIEIPIQGGYLLALIEVWPHFMYFAYENTDGSLVHGVYMERE